MEKELTGRVLRFQRTGEGLQEIVETLAERIYAFPRTARGWKEDDCGEFFLFFFPRLVRKLVRFRDCGLPFEYYLSAVLGWELKSYFRQRRRKERAWQSSARPRLWGDSGVEDLEAAEEPEPAGWGEDSDVLDRTAVLLGLDGEGRVRRPADRRRLLLLVLKGVRTARPEDLERTAFWCGLDPEPLQRAAEELRRCTARQELRLEKLRQRRNRTYTRLALLEEELQAAIDPACRRPLQERAQRLRSALRGVQEKIARIPLRPSNREIAEVLGLPKGSVDSSLFWLRRKVGRLQAAEQKEYA